MRVVIAGAGIGGLALASFLKGESITVVERRPEPSGIGAGLLLQDKALAEFHSMGVKVSGKRFNQICLALADGQRLPSLKKSGLALRRTELHSALLSACKQIDLRVSTTVDLFREDESGVDVRLSDGSEVRADILVGADGLGSYIRELHGPLIRRRYSGVTCWRGLSPRDYSANEPLEIWGRGLRVGIVPLESGTYLYLTESTSQNQLRIPAPADKFSHFAFDAPALIESVPNDKWVHRDLDELDGHFWGTARVPLLGDAAHGFTPNLGEGAAQAIIDAAQLARHLRENAPYPGPRRRKNAQIAFLSRWMGRIGQASGKKGALRDTIFMPLATHR